MKYLLLVFFLFPVCLVAQNLVPNPNFEEYHSCPYDVSQTSVIYNWIYPSQTPDYFNSCDTTKVVSVPQNIFGYQIAVSGNGYIGVFTRATHSDSFPYREILGTRLIDSLIIGKKYYASIKVSLADSSNCASNNIGLLLSTSPLLYDYPILLPNHANLYAKSIIKDTSNWVVISGSFIADSFYKYIFVGNFFDDRHTDSTLFNVTRQGIYYYFDRNICNAYYYIGDVCVSTDSLECNLSNGINSYVQNEGVKVYPIPASGLLNIYLPNKPNIMIVYDVIGHERYHTINKKNKTSVDVSSFPNGIYFLKVNTGNNILYKQFIIQK